MKRPSFASHIHWWNRPTDSCKSARADLHCFTANSLRTPNMAAERRQAYRKRFSHVLSCCYYYCRSKCLDKMQNRVKQTPFERERGIQLTLVNTRSRQKEAGKDENATYSENTYINLRSKLCIIKLHKFSFILYFLCYLLCFMRFSQRHFDGSVQHQHTHIHEWKLSNFFVALRYPIHDAHKRIFTMENGTKAESNICYVHSYAETFFSHLSCLCFSFLFFFHVLVPSLLLLAFALFARWRIFT